MSKTVRLTECMLDIRCVLLFFTTKCPLLFHFKKLTHFSTQPTKINFMEICLADLKSIQADRSRGMVDVIGKTFVTSTS
jgi:hypothetical protein